MANQKPVEEVRIGRVKATVWRNGTDEQPRYNVTFSRLYKESDQWKSTQSFGRNDLLVLAKVADLVHTRILQLRDQSSSAHSLTFPQNKTTEDMLTRSLERPEKPKPSDAFIYSTIIHFIGLSVGTASEPDRQQREKTARYQQKHHHEPQLVEKVSSHGSSALLGNPSTHPRSRSARLAHDIINPHLRGDLAPRCAPQWALQ